MVLVGSDSGLGGAVHHCGLPSALAGSGKTPAARAAFPFLKAGPGILFKQTGVSLNNVKAY